MAHPEVSHHDVVIVGARCAGSATARLLAERGHDVVVLDRAEFPSDTLSTHGIARGGVVQLSRWGLLDDVLASGAPAIREVTFGIEGREITREVKDRAGVDVLVAPRRMVLDTILADAAITSGATVRTSTAVTDVIRDDTGRVTGVSGPHARRPRPHPVRPPCRGGGRAAFDAGSTTRCRDTTEVLGRRLALLHLRRPGALARLRVPHRTRRLRRRVPHARRAGLRLAVPPHRSPGGRTPSRRTADRGVGGRDRGGRALARAAHQVGTGGLGCARHHRSPELRAGRLRTRLGPRR